MSKNYKELLRNAIIPDNYTDQNEKACADFENYIDSKFPIKLYRYRAITEKSLTAFLKDELWFANGTAMNDDFDSRIFYDKKRIINFLNSLVTESGGLKPIDNILCMDSIPPIINCIIPNASDEICKIKKLDKTEIDIISNKILHFVYDNIDDELRFITNFIQEETKFACFTTNIQSNTMWGQYADCSTGFTLEYEFDKRSSEYQNKEYKFGISCDLYPIDYDQRRLDATEFAFYLFQISILYRVLREKGISIPNQFRNMVVPCPDSFMFKKVALVKSNEWKKEKEWRMFFNTSIQELNNERFSYVYKKPSALYLGRKISELYQKVLVEIAKEKSIPVYKMDFNEKNRTYNLRKIKYIGE